MAALYDGDDNRVFTASRKEGKHTYQLFKKQVKSPYTAPGGEEHSLFWYGFSQNVLQSLSILPQTVGTIWHDIFDDVSTAYHKKVAKDRANDEGLVVNPPDLGNLPGEGDVTYASQVKDVLIPYTTREDSFHYYEERNYVNDVNREHTEVLQTYDRELKARDTYTYGNGRTSYLNNETGKHYHYLTNQAGSVTGLAQGGKAVASSSYNLYGSTKESTDETENPFAYNGEARDVTGLDYLRARYYDSEAGTFLTEDSYQGEMTDPLSQNLYSYVHNNPVNYTDPSGHFLNKIVKGVQNLWNGAKKLYHQAKTFVGNQIQSAINFGKNAISWVGTQINNARNWATQQRNNYQSRTSYHAALAGGYGGSYGGGSSYAYTQQQQAQQRAQAEQRRQQAVRDEFTQATGIKDAPKSREGQNLLRNWGSALAKIMRHVCTTADKVEKQDKKSKNKIDWKKFAPVIKYGAAFASGLVSGLDIVGQGLDASSGVGGILRSINPIAKMGGKTGFVIQNTSSPFYKAGTLFNKIGQKAAPVAKVLGSKTFKVISFGAGVLDDIANQGKTFGQAVAHNGAELAVAAAASLLTPVGWGIIGAAAVGVAAGFVFDAAYNSNFGGTRDGLDWVGNQIDKGVNILLNPPKRKALILV